jgi:DNA-binding transcriptional regulator GbsR (MarR family)
LSDYYTRKSRLEAEERVLALLSLNPMKVSEIRRKTGLGDKRLQRSLVSLERKGLVKRLKRKGYWQRSEESYIREFLEKALHRVLKAMGDDALISNVFDQLGVGEDARALVRIRREIERLEAEREEAWRRIIIKLGYLPGEELFKLAYSKWPPSLNRT